MAAGFYTFDPSQVAASLGEILLSGWAEDTMIEAERPEQMYVSVAGVDGQVTRVKTSDKRGTVAFNLMQSSDTNDLLSALMISDEQSNAGVRPLLIKDVSGRTVLSATSAWIQKAPNVGLSKTAQSRIWVVECAKLEVFVGGN